MAKRMNWRRMGAGTVMLLMGIVLVARTQRHPYPTPYNPQDPVARHAYLQWYEHITENALTGLCGLLLIGAAVALAGTTLVSYYRQRRSGDAELAENEQGASGF
jgi:hypothetical protein